MRWLARYRIHILLFTAGLVAYAAVAGARLGRQSSDPHFVLQADAWLSGQLAIDPAKKRGDDWAILETVELDDGTRVQGRRLHTRRAFRVTGGAELPLDRVRRTVDRTHYVSFPPLPAVLMLPQVALRGHRANDVAFTVVIAALILPLAFAALRRLHHTGASRRTVAEDLWLTAALGIGSVLFFSAVQGRVWFTAHVVGVALTLAYACCALGARAPMLAGLCLGLATMTRAPLAFMFPLFALEAWRVAGGRQDVRRFLSLGVRFAVPVVLIAAVAMVHNYVRFAEVTEFGHTYLAVRQQQQMETYGMFDYHYLGRNLAVAFTLLPALSTQAPYVSISGHGLALWVTTPLLLLLLWPRTTGPVHRALWLTVALVAVPTLLYQNSGWVQFGYRFSLDYMAFLIMLLAVGGRPLGRTAKALIIAGVVINLFGAITFARDWRYYRTDGRAYAAVVAH